jgi:hypothetical protein
MSYARNYRVTGFLRSAAAVKVSTAGSLLSSKLFGFFVCIYFLFLFFFFPRHAGVRGYRKPGTIYCVTFRPRFFPLSRRHRHRTPFLHYTLYLSSFSFT